MSWSNMGVKAQIEYMKALLSFGLIDDERWRQQTIEALAHPDVDKWTHSTNVRKRIAGRG